MNVKTAVLASGVLLACSASARAQIEPQEQTGTRVPLPPDTLATEKAGNVRKGFGRCVYRRHPDVADALLRNSDPAGIDFEAAGVSTDKLHDKLSLEFCMGSQARGNQAMLGVAMKPTTLRALLLEEAYLGKYRAAPVAASMTPAARRFFAAAEKEGEARAMADFADCLAETDTPAADRLLRTMPGSTEEETAARGLAPTLGACLTEGQTLTFTPHSIRAYAADGLWNRYVAGTPASEAGR